ncbi:MAG: AAA family ATPase [Leptolyngbyaceae cyanobacterium]
MSGLMSFDEAFRVADLAVRAVRSEGLRDIERVVLEGSWNRQTYQKIASEAGYTEGYLSRDVGPGLWDTLSKALGVQVKKTNFRTAIERWSEQAPPSSPATSADSNGAQDSTSVVIAPVPASIDPLPFDVTDFRGRAEILAALTDWVLQEQGRLLCLSGLPGSGKSWLAIKLADQVRSRFQRLVYRKLSDRPAPTALITFLQASLGLQPSPSHSLGAAINALVQVLTDCPTLIVLDSTEQLCSPQQLAGRYDDAFQGYLQLLSALANREHPSCVFWVGREFPREICAMAGSSCRLETVEGLTPEEISMLAPWSDNVTATPAEWQQLQETYGGLPDLILGEVAAPLMKSFRGQLGPCLAALHPQNRAVTDYIDNWLAPLSDMEWQILFWLMLSRRSLTQHQLREYLGRDLPLRALESLYDRGVCRSVVQAEPAWDLVLPQLLIPYLCDRFLASFFAADESQQFEWLGRYALVQTDAPAMTQQWQRQTLLTAVAQHLEKTHVSYQAKRQFLASAFHESQRLAALATPTYRPGNIINLAQHWQISLVNVDLQGLQLRGADLQSDLFQGMSLSGADLTQALLAQPMGQSPVIAVNLSATALATGDQDGRLLLWDLQTGRLRRAMLAVSQAIRAIAFSSDGHTLAEARQDGTIRLWDLRSEYGPEHFTDDAGTALTSLVFSPDKQLLAGSDEAGGLHIWQLASGQEVYTLAAHQGSVTAIAFSPCSKRLLSCGQDCAAYEWDLAETGEAVVTFRGRLTNLLGTVAYLPSATAELTHSVVVGRDENQLVIWDMKSARPVCVIPDSCEAFMAVALSTDGRYLATSDVSKQVSIWEVKSRSRLCQLTDHPAPVESLVFIPNRAELMTSCDYTVQRWQIPASQCLRVWRSDRHPARQLALSTSPLQLLSSHDDATLRCWQFVPARQRWLPQERLQIPDPSLTRTLACSPAAAYWAIGTEGGNIHLWDCQQQIWDQRLLRLPKAVTALAFSPDGILLAAGDVSGTVALWDLENRIFRWQKTQAHAAQVMALTFSPDGRQVVSGSRDRTIRRWNVKGEALQMLIGHRRRVHSVCFSRAGDQLYSGSYDGTVRTWQVSDSECQNDWQFSEGYIHQITLDEQHRPVAIVSDTQTIELWEITTQTRRARFTPHAEVLWHIGASPDGRSLVCAGQSGEISLWSLATGQEQGRLRVDRPYEGMQIGNCSGLTASERQMLHSLGASDY